MLLDTPVCDFGWKAPSFTLPDLDGSSVSSTEQMGENGMLVAFICNHCPYVQRIISKFVIDADTLKEEGINVMAIMSNDFHSVREDAPSFMKQFALQHGMNFPYLLDEDQSVAQAYGAVCTPDFFGFNRDAELQYRGQFDNAGMGNIKESVHEMLNAMREISKTGNGPRQQTPSIGCSIKWK